MFNVNYTKVLKIATVCITLVFMIKSPLAFAQTGDWTGNGPFGGSVYSYAVDETNGFIYAGTHNGIWKSLDNGSNWELSLATEGNLIASIAILPDNPNVIYASSNGPEIYKTTNGGRTWDSINPYPDDEKDNQVGVALWQKRSTVKVYVARESGVFISDDYGQTWENIASDEVHPLGPIVVDPGDKDIIYVGTSNGIYKTETGDTNWVQLTNGLQVNPVISLKLNPLNSNTVYAILHNVFPEPETEGLFKSVDAGASWVKLDSTITGSGRYWTFDMLAIDPVDTNVVYAAEKNYILKSIDGGFGWDTLLTYSEECISIAVDPANPAKVFGGLEHDGLLKSIDSGLNWSPSGYGLLGVLSPTEVILNPTKPEEIFVGGFGGYEGGGVFKSDNGGQNWQTINTGLTSKDVRCLALNPDDPNIIYAGTRRGIYTSVDGGNTWQQNTSFPVDLFVENIITNPVSTGILYVTYGNVIYKTEDGGVTWSEFSTVGGGFDGMIIDMVMDPSNPDVLYSGNQMFVGSDRFGGLFKSADGGLTWIELADQGIMKIAVDPQDSLIIYYGTTQHGLYKSVDGGNTWNQRNSGLGAGPDLPHINDIVIDPVNPDTLYAVVSNDGVYHSDNGGLTWEPMYMQGLPWKNVSGLTLDSRNSTLYASINGGGVYRYQLAPVGIKDNNSSVPIVYSLAQNYPNPFNPETTIKYQLPIANYVELAVYNLLGQKVKTLVSTNQSMGTYNVSWNGVNEAGQKAASGIYIYQLNASATSGKTAGFTETRKMILVR